MKNEFKGFYNPTDEMLEMAWKSDNTVFVFDTNVFLNLYGYAEQTRSDFFELLDAIEQKIWIPYQVALEYQRRRLEIIKEEKAIFNKINNNLEKIEKVFKQDFEELALKRRFPQLHKNTDKLNKEIQKSITNYKKSVSYWDEKQPCVRSHDFIREKLNERSKGKVGSKPKDQNWLDELYVEGEERYKNRIPPGFKDDIKAKAPDRYFYYDGLKYDRQFGDLILWKQLLEKAKTDEVENVIFITDDSKEDWWYILDSRGKKQIGPHANLQSEIYSYTNINLFHMYNTSSFLENGKKVLEIGVHESSINDANKAFQDSLADEKIKNHQLELLKAIRYKNRINDLNLRNSNTNNRLENLKKVILDISSKYDNKELYERYAKHNFLLDELSEQKSLFDEYTKSNGSYDEYTRQFMEFEEQYKDRNDLRKIYFDNLNRLSQSDEDEDED